MNANVRSSEIEALARRLAEMEHSDLDDAIVLALSEAIARRSSESPRETAIRIMKERGITPSPTASIPVSQDVYHELDGDLF